MAELLVFVYKMDRDFLGYKKTESKCLFLSPESDIMPPCLVLNQNFRLPEVNLKIPLIPDRLLLRFFFFCLFFNRSALIRPRICWNRPAGQCRTTRRQLAAWP